ncbi:MAG: DUF5110 domain-containing protein [Lachnospiraceae bacterium]|nr:DUF5110 domain-containing protein [Lachnospiraceae bacterium]
MLKKFLASCLVGVMTLTTAFGSLASFGVTAPVAKADAEGYKVIVGDVRVETLSDTLVRVEMKGAKGFEDRKTYHVENREFDFVTPTVTTKDGVTSIATKDYTVLVPEGATSMRGIKIVNNTGKTVWNYTSLPTSSEYLPDPGDTPDAWEIADTPRIVPAEWGYAPMPSGVTDNADINGWDDDNQADDMYVFLPKRDYKTLVKDFTKLTGPAEMVPLKYFGLWHSRYYAYTDQEVLGLIDTYRNEIDYPLDNMVVDTDWRKGGSDGYNIDPIYFPDMEGFLTAAHNKNVSVTFNDHPEPEKINNVRQHALTQIDLNYRNENLKRLINMGLDTWWFDRNWHTCITPPFSGINKESFGMYIYQDITRQVYGEDKRPTIMGNVDGVDNGAFNRAPDMSSHKYTLQWTGDTVMDQLEREIMNVSRMGVNMGLAYTSSDIPGHNGYIEDQLWTRWTQYAALSPFIRYHGSHTPEYSNDHSPFARGKEAQDIGRDYINMRYRLLPLFYELSHENYVTGLPMCRRLDINYPQYEEAKDNHSYLLGDNILFAPVYAATNDECRELTRDVFIPDGTWVDVWTGDTVKGPANISVTHQLETTPIYVRQGSITALAQNMKYIGEKDWSKIAVDVYPGTALDGENTLYEDDEISCKYKKGEYRETALTTSYDKATKETVVKIGEGKGTFAGSNKFTNREWKVRIHMPEGWGNITAATLNGENVLSDVTVINKDVKAMPFAIEGGAADGKIAELTFTKPISSASEVRVKFANPVEEEVTLPTNASVAADVDVDLVEDDVNLTAVGTEDWAKYEVVNGAVATTHKNNGKGLIGDIKAAASVSEADTGFNFAFTDGKEKASATSSKAASVKRKDFKFDVKVGTQAKQINLYLGGDKAAGTLLITDGVSFSKSINVTATDEKSLKRISVVADASKESVLHFTYSRVDGTGGINIAAIAIGEPESHEPCPVEFTASLEAAPTTLDLSDSKYKDWMHFGLNSDTGAVNRKAGVTPILEKAQIDGSTMEVHDYTTAFSWDGGSPSKTANGKNNAIALLGTADITVPSSDKLSEFCLYIGVWNAKGVLKVYDDFGSEVTTFKFSANDGAGAADTRCLKVRFRSDRKSKLHIKWDRENYNTGNISLAGYTLSQVGASDMDATVSMSDAPEKVNLTQGTDAWKAFGVYSVNSHAAKKKGADMIGDPVSIQPSNLLPGDHSKRLQKGDDYRTEFSWTDGDEDEKAEEITNFIYSKAGEKLTFDVDRGAWDINVYACAWRAKGLVQVVDSKDRLVGQGVIDNTTNGSVYKKINVKANVKKADTLTVYITTTLPKDGFDGGNTGMAAATATKSIDSSDITKGVSEAAKIDTSKYTAESVKALQAALEAAKKVAADPKATQEAIDKAASALEAAIKGLVSTTTPGASATTIKLAKTAVSVAVGKSVTVKATVTPASKETVAWTSSNPKVATVAAGKITGKAVGTAKVTAKVAGKTATVTVKVLPKAVKKFSAKVKGKKVTVKITKGDKKAQTMIQYRKVGAKSYKKLTLTKSTSFAKKLKKGKYEIRVASYIKTGGVVYQSAFSKAKKVTIK